MPRPNRSSTGQEPNSIAEIPNEEHMVLTDRTRKQYTDEKERRWLTPNVRRSAPEDRTTERKSSKEKTSTHHSSAKVVPTVWQTERSVSHRLM